MVVNQTQASSLYADNMKWRWVEKDLMRETKEKKCSLVDGRKYQDWTPTAYRKKVSDLGANGIKQSVLLGATIALSIISAIAALAIASLILEAALVTSAAAIIIAPVLGAIALGIGHGVLKNQYNKTLEKVAECSALLIDRATQMDVTCNTLDEYFSLLSSKKQENSNNDNKKYEENYKNFFDALKKVVIIKKNPRDLNQSKHNFPSYPNYARQPSANDAFKKPNAYSNYSPPPKSSWDDYRFNFDSFFGDEFPFYSGATDSSKKPNYYDTEQPQNGYQPQAEEAKPKAKSSPDYVKSTEIGQLADDDKEALKLLGLTPVKYYEKQFRGNSHKISAYDILGLKQAEIDMDKKTDDEKKKAINKNYRQLSLKWADDKPGGDKRVASLLNRAKEKLFEFYKLS